MSRPTCIVEGCQRPQYSWKMCEMHYRRVKRSGGTAPTNVPYARRVDPDAPDDGETLRYVSEVKVVTAETVQYWVDQAEDWREEWEHERKLQRTSDYERQLELWRDWSTPTQRWVWGRGLRHLRPDGVTPGPWDPDTA
jgi:hypothetical protein